MKKFGIFLLFIAFAGSLFAKIELPVIFSNNMVLQQQTNAPIWGKATPGSKVEIYTSWDKQTYTTNADGNGKWKLLLKTPVAGGPYDITISDGKKLTLSNVLIGEVWICSGQSNMEMPLAGWGKVLNYEQEIAAANYSGIRLLQVDKETSTQALSDLKVSSGGWQVCSPATIAEFSSTAYFFGRNLHQNMNNIPIGLINTSWGGTIAEAWTSAESLETMPDFVQAVQNIKSTDAKVVYEEQMKQWTEQLIAIDKGMKDNQPYWANVDLDDSNWSTMTLPGLWGKQLNQFNGIVWFRYTVDIPATLSGKDLILSLGMIDDNDITYFNGKQIGATEGHAASRNYIISGKQVKSGKQVITVRVLDTGGEGGFNGNSKDMYIALKSKPNNPAISLATDWKYSISVSTREFPRAPSSPNNPNRPTVLYNAMIHPIVPYAIKGAIWYQGESNADRAYQYRDLFPLMIRDWRKQWNSEFPFYFVQLANFMDIDTEPEDSQWAELREAQLQTLNLNNTGMAVIIDIGDDIDIHPKDKQGVGNRLALAARAKTYGQNIAYSGPIYKSYTIENNQIRIKFDHTNGGLKTKDSQPVKGFAIAGPDHKFYWADAKIEGNEIVVSSPKVLFPVAVRYAWSNNPVCNLYNGANLPASPFRTDDYRK